MNEISSFKKLTHLQTQSSWGFRKKEIRTTGLTVYYNYLKKYILLSTKTN